MKQSTTRCGAWASLQPIAHRSVPAPAHHEILEQLVSASVDYFISAVRGQSGTRRGEGQEEGEGVNQMTA